MKKEHSNKIILKILSYYIGIISIFSLLPMIIISFYSHPSLDDFGYSITTLREWNTNHSLVGLLIEAIRSSYERMYHWQGLYTSGVILSLQPAIFNESLYGLGAVFLILGIYISMYFFLREVLHYVLEIKIWIVRLITLVICFYYINFMPSGVEGLYWFNGAYNYTFFLILWLISIAILIRVIRTQNKRNIGLIALDCFLSFMISGGNHVSAFLNIIVLLALLLYVVVVHNWYLIKRIGALLFITSVGFVINLSAPGTKVRQECFTSRPTLPKAVLKSCMTTLYYIAEWMSAPYFITLILLIPFGYFIAKQLRRRWNNFYKLVIGIIIVTWLLMSAMVSLPMYAMGYPGDGRLTNLVFFVFVLGSFIVEICSIGFLLEINIDFSNFLKTEIRSGIIMSFVVLFFSSLVLFMGNEEAHCKTAIKSIISGEARAYSAKLNERHELLLETNDSEVAVEYIEEKPKLLYFADITENPDDWRNGGLARYYNKNKVYIKSTKE